MTLLIGCDFSSRPSRRKPIVIARGHLQGAVVTLDALQSLDSVAAFSHWLQAEPAWVGGFDLPFGLPRELVQALGWPTSWLASMQHYAALSRAEIRDCFAAFCASRPAGRKFAHRATDRWAGSSPSMKWVNPPVAWMLHAGVPPLIASGACLPGLHPSDADLRDTQGQPRRIAMEAYPGLLAREVLGRASYKSDDRKKQTPERRAARAQLLTAFQAGQTRLALRLALTPAQAAHLCEDPRGDALDAVLCLIQAAWGWQRGWPHFGLPTPVDPLEGWIVTAEPDPQAGTP
jgi:hypothetical protein